jgi:hypothetical protein
MAHSLAVLLFDMGDLDRARTQAQEAIALYNAIDHTLGRAAAQTCIHRGMCRNVRLVKPPVLPYAPMQSETSRSCPVRGVRRTL